MIKRIVVCQGTAQLGAALAVMGYRESLVHEAAYENYLVVSDTNVPEESVRESNDLIRGLAGVSKGWTSMAFPESAILSGFMRDISINGAQDVYNKLYAMLGISSADEIYVSNNWSGLNRLMLNAFMGSRKICYGDGIGVHMPEAYASGYYAGQRHGLASIKHFLSVIKGALASFIPGKRFIRDVDIHENYINAPDVFRPVNARTGEKVPSEYMRDVMKVFSGYIDEDVKKDINKIVSGRDVTVLLVSMLYEQGMMALESEARAYADFTRSIVKDKGDVLIIKPHPRCCAVKTELIGEALRGMFGRIRVLDDKALGFMPFEAVFCGINGAAKTLRVVNFSTAGIALKYFFGAECWTGFGDHIVKRYFNKKFVKSRMEHERLLRKASGRT
jgi:hypothetical protein